MAPSECRQVYRRHGESGVTGTVAASLPLTFAIRPWPYGPKPAGVRRRLAGAQQLPWRSGAKRLSSAADQEPKVAGRQ
ncbi:TPA: hypothetical protein G9F28_005039 [Salmonella enterica]|nr:hypothetical protein [Salmonella enterica]